MAITTTNPATGEVIETFAPLTTEQVETALARAAAAATTYRRTTFDARAEWLKAAADLLDAEREAMARSYGSASGVYGAGGVPLSPSTYYGWQGGMASLPAGVPLSPSTYTSMGVMAS